jgi:hypothetical protein
MISLVNGVSLWSILTARNLTDLDALLAPSYGYTSVHDYYGDCAPAPHAHNIAVPTLALSAIDDPVCNHAAAPLPLSIKGIERNVYVCVCLSIFVLNVAGEMAVYCMLPLILTSFGLVVLKICHTYVYMYICSHIIIF